jgi:hypothetical protein
MLQRAEVVVGRDQPEPRAAGLDRGGSANCADGGPAPRPQPYPAVSESVVLAHITRLSLGIKRELHADSRPAVSRRSTTSFVH